MTGCDAPETCSLMRRRASPASAASLLRAWRKFTPGRPMFSPAAFANGRPHSAVATLTPLANAAT